MARRKPKYPYFLDPDSLWFPKPSEALTDEDADGFAGLLAIGGDLSVNRLIAAYSQGIFPWYSEGTPIFWWSLDPRMVMDLDCFRFSKSLRRTVKSGRFEVRVDTCFEQVIRSCASVDRTAYGQDGTWIVEDMIEAYIRLHEAGLAHSFETFLDGSLVGGLYGVSTGMFFSGESMQNWWNSAVSTVSTSSTPSSPLPISPLLVPSPSREPSSSNASRRP